MILAIDTATEFAGLALYDENSVWAEEIWHTARNHTVELMPRLDRMLNKANVNVATLSGIAVSIGPGSYTGVRIGVAIAKGLALPHNLSVVGISTLDIVAYPHQNQRLPVVAIAQAGRKRILSATYRRIRKVWRQSVAPTLSTIAELAKQVEKPSLITGEFNADSATYLREHLPSKSEVVSPIHRIRRPAILAELGSQKLMSGEHYNLNDLAPIYLKSP